MPQSVHDYRAILKEELAKRCRRNRIYSMRAFARDLGVSSSRLSEILLGKQGLSVKVTEAEVSEAIARLVRLGMLAEREGKLLCVAPITASQTDVPSAAIKRYHTHVLDKAAAALHLQPVEPRDFGSLVFSIDESDFEDFRAKLREFRRGLANQADQTKKKNVVYCLSTQLFRLTDRV